MSKPYLPRPDKNDDRCYEADDHDSADLCAQWRAALAAEKAAETAEWGNYVGVASALLSFVSIVLVLIALGQTRKANRISEEEFVKARKESADAARDTASALSQAKRSADAAIKAVSHAEEANQIARLARRAWIAIPGPFKRPTQNGLFVLGFFENVGQTPAEDVRVVVYFEMAEQPIPIIIPEKIKGIEADLGKAPPGVVSPNVKNETEGHFIPTDTLIEIAQQKLHFFFYIHCAYTAQGDATQRVSTALYRMVFPNLVLPREQVASVAGFEIFGDMAKAT